MGSGAARGRTEALSTMTPAMTPEEQPLQAGESDSEPGVVPAQILPAPISPTPTVPAMAWIYLVLSLAGGILPWLANWDYIQFYGSGFDLGQFIALANANPASQFVSRDLAVSATAVTIWMMLESRRLKMRGLGWVLLSCITIAFAFGCLLYTSPSPRDRQKSRMPSSA